MNISHISENQQKNSNQSGEEKLGGNTNDGGFMPILHSFEAACYGPNSTLDAKTKVFYCIRHKTLWWAHQDGIKIKPILKSEIMKSTGLDKRMVEKMVVLLEKEGMIVVHRSKTGKVWNENQYEINPKIFGENFVYRPEKTRLIVHQGGKISENNSGVPSDSTVDLPNTPSVGVPSDSAVQTGSEEATRAASKVPKNIDKNLRISQREVDKKAWNKAREKLIEAHPGDEKFMDQLYAELDRTRVDDMGRPIRSLPGLIMRSYEVLKKNRENPYERSKKSEAPLEPWSSTEVIDGHMTKIYEILGQSSTLEDQNVS